MDDWNWGRAASAYELRAIDSAAKQFAEQWTTVDSPPFNDVAFDGHLVDVLALDYLHYESFGYPACGIEGAALVCGEVLRRVAGLQWVIDHDGSWFLARSTFPPSLICPLARLKEIVWARVPQFGRHFWFLQGAALECYRWVGPETRTALDEILRGAETDYLDDLAATLRKVRGEPDAR